MRFDHREIQWFSLLLVTLVTLLPIQLEASPRPEKIVVGWVEKAIIFPHAIVLHAKIDTGADHSSLNVEEMTEFIRQGEPWVRFSFTPKFQDTMTVERPVYRYTKIKRKGADSLERPVILLGLCVGGVYKPDSQVNLSDRKNFKYNMLIGRSFLSDSFIVDSALTYTVEPHCPQSEDSE